MKKPCQCAETLIGGERIMNAFHSCAEVRRRNSFLPAAESIAWNQTRGLPNSGRGHAFTRVLSITMDRLCAQGRQPSLDELMPEPEPEREPVPAMEIEPTPTPAPEPPVVASLN